MSIEMTTRKETLKDTRKNPFVGIKMLLVPMGITCRKPLVTHEL